MHFFHTFGTTPDELTISIGHTVGSAEIALVYCRNARGTELTESGTGLTQVSSVQ
jgi:hypothetical protein